MPIFAALFKVISLHFIAIYLAVTGGKLGVRIIVAVSVATAYIACVTAFTLLIRPLLSALFTSSYGQVIGFAFPPISGTLVASFVALWGCIVAKNYASRMVKIALGG